MKYFYWVPLVGQLFRTRAIDHKEAAIAWTVSLILTTVPIWFGGIMLRGLSQNASKSYWDLCLSTVSAGQLFLVATTVLAPVIYVTLRERYPIVHFPSRLAIVLSTGGIFIIATGFFAEQQAHVQLDAKFQLLCSALLFFASLALGYIAAVYDHLAVRG